MGYVVLCMMYDVWYMMYVGWCVFSGECCVVYAALYIMHVVWYMLYDVWCMTDVVCCMVHG